MAKKRLSVTLVLGLLGSFGLFGGCATGGDTSQTDDDYCYECAPCDCLSPGFSSCEEEFGDQECWLGAGGDGGAGGFGGTTP